MTSDSNLAPGDVVSYRYPDYAPVRSAEPAAAWTEIRPTLARPCISDTALAASLWMVDVSATLRPGRRSMR